MTDTLNDTGPPIRAQTARLEKPPWAAYVWSDEQGNIIIELPCPVGKAPVIVAYSPTEGGFAKAVALIVQNANIKKSPPPPGYYRHGEVKLEVKRKWSVPLKTAPEGLREAVKAAMRKAGL